MSCVRKCSDREVT